MCRGHGPRCADRPSHHTCHSFCRGLLLRLPYGKRTDECELVQFEENVPDARPPHESYLWGSGGIAAALLVGEGVRRRRLGSFDRDARSRICRSTSIARTARATATPCAEAVLSERAAERLLDMRPVSPLLSRAR